MPLKTLFLQPPSFDKFDGGASSRWPATREIESYWYPVWLAYPAGMLEGSRLLDAPPHHITFEQTVEIGKDYEFLVLATSTVGFEVDKKLAVAMKEANPKMKICFVGPPVTIHPERALSECPVIDFTVRREFDYATVEFANGKPLDEILGISFRKDGKIVHTPDRPQVQDLDALPDVTTVYKRDLDVTKYNVPFLLHPYVALYTTRGCPALCTFCLWPQTLSGHAWRKRSTDRVAAEMAHAKELWPNVKEFFFDDDTFNIQKARTIELCEKLKPLGITWSCTSRVTTDYDTLKAMKDAGCRLMIVGFESGDPQILKNIKKGATVERARDFARDAHKLGLIIHGDFILGLPGETKESIERTIQFAKDLDCETIQVSLAHAYPGTELYDYAKSNGFILHEKNMADDGGHQLAMIEYPNLPRDYALDAVHRFYDEYYFRPKAVWRIVKKAMKDSNDRKRLYREAREFMSLRSKRAKVAKDIRAEVALMKSKVKTEAASVSGD
jgi:hopanoid biosynthesis associated radical SAM protein HpnJ